MLQENTQQNQDKIFNQSTVVHKLSKVKDIVNELDELEIELSAITVLLCDKVDYMTENQNRDAISMLQRELPLMEYLTNQLLNKRSEFSELTRTLSKTIY